MDGGGREDEITVGSANLRYIQLPSGGRPNMSATEQSHRTPVYLEAVASKMPPHYRTTKLTEPCAQVGRQSRALNIAPWHSQNVRAELSAECMITGAQAARTTEPSSTRQIHRTVPSPHRIDSREHLAGIPSAPRWATPRGAVGAQGNESGGRRRFPVAISRASHRRGSRLSVCPSCGLAWARARGVDGGVRVCGWVGVCSSVMLG